jgi:Spy/CpxP family protein refolding chaperone
MKKLMLAIISILFSMAISTDLFAVDCAWVRGHGMREGAAHHCKDKEVDLFARLNLTSEQKTRIQTLREANMRDVKPLQDRMFSKRGDLKLLWLQTNPDKEKILATQKDIRELRDQMQDKATAYRVDMFNVLTPEQQEKAKTLGSGCGFEPCRGDRDDRMGPCAGMGAGRCPGAGMMGPGKGMRGN